MSRDESYTPFAKQPHAAPRAAAEVLWTVTKKGHTCQGVLRAGPEGRCELQLLADGELRTGHLHANREWAIAEATIKREALLVKGWSAP